MNLAADRGGRGEPKGLAGRREPDNRDQDEPLGGLGAPPRPGRPPLRPTRAEVDLAAVAHNVRVLRERAATDLCVVVKADAYGHGAGAVAQAALDAGAAWLAVALVEEGEQLRAAGIDAPILVLAEPPVAAVDRLMAADLAPTLYSPAFGRALDAAGRARGRPVAVHLKADTGMTRVGIPEPVWADRLAEVATWDGVRVEALWTHLARADELAADTTDRQLAAFDRFEQAARGAGLDWDFVHVGNSAGALVHPRARRDLVRVGIAAYGLSPSPEVDAADLGLRAALRLVTEVSFAKRVAAGTPASYGHRWHAPREGWLATLPVGYADGVPRLLTNRAEVLLHGRRHPIAGTVCMDQILVWCDDEEVAAGDEAVLLGAQGDGRIRVEEWAETVGTITYEIVTGLSGRVPRIHRPAGGVR